MNPKIIKKGLFMHILLLISLLSLTFLLGYLYPKNFKDTQIKFSFMLIVFNSLIYIFCQFMYVFKPNNVILLNFISFAMLLALGPSYLFFTYSYVRKKLETLFFFTIFFNLIIFILIILASKDLTNISFWRYSYSFRQLAILIIFAIIPVIIAFKNIITKILKSNDELEIKQLFTILLGALLFTIIALISEYFLPMVRPNQQYYNLIPFGFLVATFTLFIAIIGFDFLGEQQAFIYDKLFANNQIGLIIINKNQYVTNINNKAYELLGLDNHVEYSTVNQIFKDKLYDEILIDKEYSFNINSQMHYLSINFSKNSNYYQKDYDLLFLHEITFSKLQNLKKLDDLEKKVYLDSLTGLYNKRYFSEKIINSKEYNDNNISILFIDLDDFKKINDNFGHDIGDKLLANTALIISKNLDKNTIAIRFGGDEFIIIKKFTSFETSIEFAKKIHNDVYQEILLENSLKTGISISCGVAFGNYDINLTVSQADKALYKAKEKGKNLVAAYKLNKIEII